MVSASCSGDGFWRKRQWAPLEEGWNGCDDGVVAPFCFPFFTMVNGRSESTTMLVANAEVEGARRKLASASG